MAGMRHCPSGIADWRRDFAACSIRFACVVLALFPVLVDCQIGMSGEKKKKANDAFSIQDSESDDVGRMWLETNSAREDVHTTRSGLQYRVLKKGKGKFSPKDSSPCEVHYQGTTPRLSPHLLKNPKKKWQNFDSSYERGQPEEFAPKSVIKGWGEAMKLMVEGDKWELWIPTELGYGKKGSPPEIKGREILIFKMELLKIKGKKVEALCNIKSRLNCEPKELAVIEKYKDYELHAMSTEISSLSRQIKKLKGEEKADAEMAVSFLKEIKQLKIREEL
eukprot:gnl/TRDRNA2_/TRDRNA2_158372_c0_seq2.p1 gnl/TRDRNA2_/TRDRNA2_158372_c0~~gnl/TRDRNA2_/TRDRNA2_158372_c0_seq2.p1  ORF type:complete len:278 (+),score=72.50 gnl/TRDRNA2_/TRDRNA2_158372_c0_seq2:50-883(+)